MGEESEAVGPGLGPRGLHIVAIKWKRQAGRHEKSLGLLLQCCVSLGKLYNLSEHL